MPKLFIFCGVPGSGKSTIAKRVAIRLPNTVHIETDDIRSMIFNPTYTSSESEFVYSSCITLAGEALARGYDVILDGTFLRNEYRRDALRRLRGAYDSYLIVYLYCDVTIAYRRNTARKARVPQDRFNQMLPQIEVPTAALKIDTGKVSAEQAAATILLQMDRDARKQSVVGDR